MTTHILLAIVALQSADDGLTGSEILQGLPRDPVSIFALLLLVVGAGAVLWFGRPRGSGSRNHSEPNGPT